MSIPKRLSHKGPVAQQAHLFQGPHLLTRPKLPGCSSAWPCPILEVGIFGPLCGAVLPWVNGCLRVASSSHPDFLVILLCAGTERGEGRPSQLPSPKMIPSLLWFLMQEDFGQTQKHLKFSESTLPVQAGIPSFSTPSTNILWNAQFHRQYNIKTFGHSWILQSSTESFMI